MASQFLVSTMNKKKEQKHLTNASIVKMGSSGGGFRGVATIEETEAAALLKIFKNPGCASKLECCDTFLKLLYLHNLKHNGLIFQLESGINVLQL